MTVDEIIKKLTPIEDKSAVVTMKNAIEGLPVFEVQAGPEGVSIMGPNASIGTSCEKTEDAPITAFKGRGSMCFYHSSDLDGYTSGAIIKDAYTDTVLVPWSYGNKIPEIPNHTDVFLVDLSFPIEEMQKLNNRESINFIWIDHHKSAIEDADSHGFNPLGIREIGKGACELCWNYCHGDQIVPRTVKLLSQYDVWDNSDSDNWENSILPFQYGMRTICDNPDSFPTPLLHEEDADLLIDSLIDKGRGILDYQKSLNTKACKSAFGRIFHGYKAVCVNSSFFNSTTFSGILEIETFDLMINCQFNGVNWALSFYSTNKNVDCSRIAKMYGGGGHLQAAGCLMPKETFDNDIAEATKVFVKKQN